MTGSGPGARRTSTGVAAMSPPPGAEAPSTATAHRHAAVGPDGTEDIGGPVRTSDASTTCG